jgi:hypothetical protein
MVTTTTDGIILGEGDDTFAPIPTIFDIVDETTVQNADGTTTTTVIQGVTKKVTIT